MYESGKGIMQDHKKAGKLYRLAAEQGHNLAQNYLGVLYVSGQGVSQDYVLAYMWFSLSGSRGFKDGIKNQKKIEKKMSKKQIEEAKKLVRNWESTKYK
ncbi:MAG: hypothetical protein CM1200mP16_06870 [Nitrospina sp.]|nr:MAG: hypothetical protein CM1200mP16_06870 [Nitrospina sp.]